MELGSEYDLALSEMTIKQNNIYNYLSEYPYQTYFDSGRSALKHVASFLQTGKKILLPEFICESVVDCFENQEVCFYKLHDNFSINISDMDEKIDSNTQAIFIMHYFGALQKESTLQTIKQIAEKNELIIFEDTTHSVFSKSSTIGDYQICSIRKWLPLPGGGVLYSKNDKLSVNNILSYEKSIDNNRAYGMMLKNLYLKTGFDCNSIYRSIFTEAEKRLDQQKKIQTISDFSRFISKCIDIEQIKECRVNNYLFLQEKLFDMKIAPAIALHDNDCPLVLPIQVNNRDEFRTYLMENRIYCAVHWPFDSNQRNNRPFAEKCAKQLISLPIDQRYGKEEMIYMIDVINRYRGELRF